MPRHSNHIHALVLFIFFFSKPHSAVGPIARRRTATAASTANGLDLGLDLGAASALLQARRCLLVVQTTIAAFRRIAPSTHTSPPVGRPHARTSPSANNASEQHPKNHAQKTLTLNTLITLTPTFIFNTEKKIFLKIYIAPLL
jgi:hypothetical protein